MKWQQGSVFYIAACIVDTRLGRCGDVIDLEELDASSETNSPRQASSADDRAVCRSPRVVKGREAKSWLGGWGSVPMREAE